MVEPSHPFPMEGHNHKLDGRAHPRECVVCRDWLEGSLGEITRLRLRPGDQPLPTPNERADVQSQLIEHIRGRRNLGIQRYGTALQPFNGRDAGQDLLDELLDGATYAMQLVIERRELEERNNALQCRVAELEAENRTLRQDRATLAEDIVCRCVECI